MKPAMTSAKQLAKHFRDVYFGGNWTAANLKDLLEGVTWQQATANIHQLNSIAMLVFHINYYVNPVLGVLRGGPLTAHDKFSFDLAPVQSEEDWQRLVSKVMKEAEEFAGEMEKLDESVLYRDFTDPKYGTIYRNLLGIIEHTYYHLGQIALIRKMLDTREQ